MPSNPNKTSFNVLLTQEEHAKLSELARLESISRGAIVRRLIASLFAMRREGCPVCASGHPCLVPHMHGRPTVPLEKPNSHSRI